MITVKELRALLKEVDGDLFVAISIDSEGNDYKPLSEDYTVARGSVYKRDFEFSEEGKPNCVILWPGYWSDIKN